MAYKAELSQSHMTRQLVEDPLLLGLNPTESGLAEAKSVAIELTCYSSRLAEFRSSDSRFLLNIVGSGGTIEACLRDLRDWLVDGIVSKVTVHDEADLLLVRASSDGRVWLCYMRRGRDEWYLDALCSDRPSFVSTDYTIASAPEQLQDLSDAHAAFMNFAGRMLARSTTRTNRVLLRAKVDRSEHWFMRFPLGIFAKFHLEGFESYAACQWIVTERTISSISAAQANTERDLANTICFLSRSHIVLNTYQSHGSAVESASVNKGFDLLLELLGYFQRVALRKERLSLKWTMNPSLDQLYSIMFSPETQFLFADFEAAGGFWTLGDGVHRCHTPCDHLQPSKGQTRVDLECLRGRLEHIGLMRVFHCNSLYDPYKLRAEPADDGTIAAALLATKAYFVEGSVTAEPVMDFIATMLNVLLRREDLRAILFAKSLAGECDVSRLIERANALLCKRGFATIE